MTEEFLRDLDALVNIESYSYDPAGINAVAAWFYERFQALGWQCEYVDLNERCGRVLKVCNRTADWYDVTFVGHMDTVYPKGTLTKRPFRVEGNRAYGLGVCDMKQGDLAMYYIAKTLDSETLDRVNICMLFNPDEEIGSRYSKDYLDTIAGKSKKVFVMEACLLDGSYCFSRKGKYTYRFGFHGKSAHAGFAWEVENSSAVLELGHWICELMDLRDKEKGTTVNVAPVSGGIGCNTVPDYAQMDCEMRFYSNEEGQRIQNRIRELLATPFVPGVTVEILEYRAMPAWRATKETLVYIEEVRAIAESLGQKFEGGWRGGLSDANHMAEHCPIVIDGMGPRGQYGHSEKECMDITGVETCITLCRELIRHM